MNKQWSEVDHYITHHLIKEDATLEEVLEANKAAGLPAVDVAPNQAKFLYILALIKGAKRILEIGTLGGYSTIWLAKALPKDGKLLTLEYNPKHVEVATANITNAGVADLVDIITGPALDTLSSLYYNESSKFDLIFIDADKENNAEYLKWAIKLSKKGTVIIGDNVVRKGEVTNSSSSDRKVQGIRRYYEALGQTPNLISTAIQTVGEKGYDGFSIGVVK
ncbi:O-methyltransferase [Bacillus spongiae]|uniref:O-methyltransferase n=1 Tax=Bacillus spongiae TaxID=2683610 RepID=A0ABU8HCS9_9BACI